MTRVLNKDLSRWRFTKSRLQVEAKLSHKESFFVRKVWNRVAYDIVVVGDKIFGLAATIEKLV